MNRPVRVIKRSRLLEISLVSVPANPDARIFERTLTGAVMPDDKTPPTQPAPTPDTKAAPTPQPDPATLRPAAAPAVVTGAPRQYSVAKALAFAMHESGIDFGLEREMHTHLAKSRDFKGVGVPYAAILRKTSNGQDTLTATPGGVLAATDRLLVDLLADTEDAIRKATILGSLGVTVVAVPGDQKVRVPIKKKGGAPGWVARDGTATVSDLEFDDLEATPKTLAIAAQLNRSSTIYTIPSMEGIVRQELADAVVDSMNDAFLHGSGASNQPTGLLKALDDASRDFTSTLNSGVTRLKFRQFATNYVRAYAESGRNRAWLLNPKTVDTLRTTPAWTGAQEPIMTTDGELAGLPVVQSFRAHDTGSSPGDPLAVVGDFGDCFAITFGPALDLVANPFADSVFLAGGVLVRGLLDLDFLFRDVKRLAMASDVIAS